MTSLLSMLSSNALIQNVDITFDCIHYEEVSSWAASGNMDCGATKTASESVTVAIRRGQMEQQVGSLVYHSVL